MRYLTDSAIEKIDGLQGLDQDGIAQALTDAARVYRYIKQNEGIAETELREYGERNDLPPDRMTAALAVLQSQHRVYGMDDDVPLPQPDD